MATQQSCIDFILEQTAEAGRMSAKRVFGEYGLYCDSKIVALVCDDKLFVKPTTAGKKFIGDFEEGFPYPGAKAYILISVDLWDDSEWLSQLMKITASELPMPTPTSPRKNVKGKKVKG